MTTTAVTGKWREGDEPGCDSPIIGIQKVQLLVKTHLKSSGF